MVKVDKACCCFSVKTGTYVIGTFLVIDLIAEFWHPTVNWARWAVKLFVAWMFLWMYIKDTKSARMMFFIAYIAQIFLKPLVNAMTNDSDDPESDKAWNGLHDFDKLAKEACEKMEKDDPKAAKEWGTLDECTVKMKKVMWRATITVGVLAAIIWLAITIHFGLVIYTFWQNSDLPVEDGGTGEDKHELKEEA